MLGGVVALVLIAIGSLAPDGDTDTPANADATEEHVVPLGCEYVIEEMVRGLVYLGVEYGVTIDKATLRDFFKNAKSPDGTGPTILEKMGDDEWMCFVGTLEGWANSNADWAVVWKETIIEDGNTPLEGLEQIQAGLEAYEASTKEAPRPDP